MAKKVSASRSKKSVNPMLKRLGGAIRRRRERAGLSQEQLAKTIHCSVERLDEFEKGLRDPKMNAMADIANALNCRFHDIAGEAKI